MPGQARTSFNLQATLSASSATAASPGAGHHPICCESALAFHEDGRFSCDHATVEADDVRTHQCVDHSIALMILEEAMKL